MKQDGKSAGIGGRHRRSRIIAQSPGICQIFKDLYIILIDLMAIIRCFYDAALLFQSAVLIRFISFLRPSVPERINA